MAFKARENKVTNPSYLGYPIPPSHFCLWPPSVHFLQKCQRNTEKIDILSHYKFNLGNFTSLHVFFGAFWLIWFINQRAYTTMLCPLLSVSLSCVYSPPSHIVRHRNLIFGVNMYTCPEYMHIKYLVILTCSFQMAVILVLFL